MTFKEFCTDNLIFGATLVAQSFQQRTKRNLSTDSHWSFMGSLILIALHYEGQGKGLRPSELTKIIGLGSRVNVEASVLTRLGYIKRIQDQEARETTLFLTAFGEVKALELIKAFKQLQGLINFSIGKRKALELNYELCMLEETLNRMDPQAKQRLSEKVFIAND